VNTLVTYNPITVAPGDSLARVVRLMDEYVLRHLPVVDDGFRVMGIISDLDVALSIENLPGGPTPDYATSGGDHDFGRLPTAADVMTRVVTSVGPNDSSAAMLQALLCRRFHSIPVVENGRLRGIVTSTDFLREFAGLAPEAARGSIARSMSAWPAVVDVSASVDAAQALMTEHACEVLGVSSGGGAVAAVTIRMLRRARHWDLVDNAAADGTLLVGAAPTVADLVDDEPGTVSAAGTLAAGATALLGRRRDALAVVDADGKPQGVLTEGDVLRSLALALAET
jgi:CBS domain-containing protein